MAELIADCPSCGSKQISHVISGLNVVSNKKQIFAICRSCKNGAIFRFSRFKTNTVLSEGQLTKYMSSTRSIMDFAGVVNDFCDVELDRTSFSFGVALPPDYLDEKILPAFVEGAQCLAVGCNNAAGAMFRLCLDLATKNMLPPDGEEATRPPPQRARKFLKARLDWLFEEGRLPKDLAELTDCLREDGNDAAHAGSLMESDAKDLLDFTALLLERLYTVPEKARLAKVRRDQRRQGDV